MEGILWSRRLFRLLYMSAQIMQTMPFTQIMVIRTPWRSFYHHLKVNLLIGVEPSCKDNLDFANLGESHLIKMSWSMKNMPWSTEVISIPGISNGQWRWHSMHAFLQITKLLSMSWASICRVSIILWQDETNPSHSASFRLATLLLFLVQSHRKSKLWSNWSHIAKGEDL